MGPARGFHIKPLAAGSECVSPPTRLVGRKKDARKIRRQTSAAVLESSHGSDGNFFSENRVQYDVFFHKGRTNWLDSEPIKPGTYYVRVDGWDPQCTFYDYGFGITGSEGCDTFPSGVAQVVDAVRRVRRGRHDSRGGSPPIDRPRAKSQGCQTWSRPPGSSGLVRCG